VNGFGQKFENIQQVIQDQSQIFLPINNALSEVGHVHLYLKEIGQGVQHIASRVHDLVSFVERANEYRELTGQGFSFLRIPRSYYGHMDDAYLVETTGVSVEVARDIIKNLLASRLIDVSGIVQISITDQEIHECLKKVNFSETLTHSITDAIKKSRYINMHKLLKDRLDEKEYLRVVKNQVLIDIQGGDILYQIFTANILQANFSDEAPFLEFIQRTCQSKDAIGREKPLRAGCGGFGIRNFLTLFLSIEVTNAMNKLTDATKHSDEKLIGQYKKMIEIFTSQLNASNPVLTKISDAMTEEARALEELQTPGISDEEKKRVDDKIKHWKAVKNEGQNQLMEVSNNYCQQMATLRTAKTSH